MEGYRLTCVVVAVSITLCGCSVAGDSDAMEACDDQVSNTSWRARRQHEKFKNRAESGDLNGMYNLAVSYARGDGVCRSYETARSWYETAARAGYTSAVYNLGWMTHEGQGGTADPLRGLSYVVVAAENGYHEACDYIEEVDAADLSEEDFRRVLTMRSEWIAEFGRPDGRRFGYCKPLYHLEEVFEANASFQAPLIAGQDGR